jgi:hypothetical protein
MARKGRGSRDHRDSVPKPSVSPPTAPPAISSRKSTFGRAEHNVYLKTESVQARSWGPPRKREGWPLQEKREGWKAGSILTR